MASVGHVHPDKRSAPSLLVVLLSLAVTAAAVPILALLRIRLAFDDVLPEPNLSGGLRIDELVFGAFSVIGAGDGLILIVAPIAGWLWVRRRADGAFLVTSVVAALALGRIIKAVFAAPRPVTYGEEVFGVRGVPELVLGAVVLGLLLVAMWRRWRPIALAVAAMIVVTVTITTGTDLLIPVRHDFDAFPSGHAIGSMAAVAALTVLAWPSRFRTAVIIVGIALVLGIGVSRVYVGAHYPADVVAGWCLAVTAVVGVWYGRCRIEARADDTTQADAARVVS